MTRLDKYSVLLGHVHEFSIVRRHICEAMAPFEPGDVTVFINDFNGLIEVQISLFPGFVAKVETFVGLYGDQDQVAASVGRMAGKYFASIREPIGPHICLGEN